MPEAIWPTRLRLPALRVDAPIVVLGVTAEGVPEVPDSPYVVGWYDFGALPGQRGNVVLAGHRDLRGRLGVFWDLGKLAPGDEVYVYDGQGAAHPYVVESSQLYDDAGAPAQEIMGSTAEAVVTLITCEGSFDQSARNYQQRRVVRAKLVAY